MTPSSTPACSVVTGGAGFIGSHLVDRLVERGERVLVVDDLSNGDVERVHPDAGLLEIDVADADALLDLARREHPTRWFHLAAQADVRVSVQSPLVDAHTNVLGTIAVLEAARRNGARIVMASTGGAIYGDADVIPTPESAPERPLSPYGAAKLAAEAYVRTYARLYGGDHAIVRYANVYGPRQDLRGEAGVVAIFAGCIGSDETPTIYGDGTQTRDYTYIADVVDATLHAADRPLAPGEAPIWNVGTGVETSVLDLWHTLRAIAGTSLDPEFAPARTGELDRSALDATLARTTLGVAIDTPLRTGLELTLAWMREHVPT